MGVHLPAILLVIATFNRVVDGQNDFCYKVRWNLGTSNIKESVIKPVTAFPKEHPLVTHGYCGGKSVGDPIPSSGLWSESGAMDAASCESVSGGAAFYVSATFWRPSSRPQGL